MFTIYHQRHRTRIYTVDLFETDGTTAVLLAADDVVRFKIYRGGASGPEVVLDANSFEEEPGGSKVEFVANTNDVCLTIGQGDVADDMPPGAYDCEFIVIDNSDHVGAAGENSIKHVEFGVFMLHPTAGGEVGDEESSSSGESSGGSSASSSSSSGIG